MSDEGLADHHAGALIYGSTLLTRTTSGAKATRTRTSLDP